MARLAAGLEAFTCRSTACSTHIAAGGWGMLTSTVTGRVPAWSTLQFCVVEVPPPGCGTGAPCGSMAPRVQGLGLNLNPEFSPGTRSYCQ